MGDDDDDETGFGWCRGVVLGVVLGCVVWGGVLLGVLGPWTDAGVV